MAGLARLVARRSPGQPTRGAERARELTLQPDHSKGAGQSMSSSILKTILQGGPLQRGQITISLTSDHNDRRASTPSLAAIAVRECTIEIHGIALDQQHVLAVNVHGKLTTDHIDDLCA